MKRFALGLALVLLALAGNSRYLNDEMTITHVAMRIAGGEVPYRDFFALIAPVPLYMLALAYKLLGASILVTHGLAAAVAGLIAYQLMRVALRLGAPPWAAGLTGAMWVFGSFTHWMNYSHHWVALACGLGALELALVGLRTGGTRWWLAAGALVGLTGISVQTDGATIGVALAAGLLGDAALHRRPLGATLRRFGALAAGTVGLLLLTIGLLAGAGALGAAITDVLLWPLRQYKGTGNVNDFAFATDLAAFLLPITAPIGWYPRAGHVVLTFVLPVLAPLLVVPFVWARGTRPAAWTPADLGLAMTGVWASLAFVALLQGRADYVHVSVKAAPALLLAGVGAGRAVSLGLGWFGRVPAVVLVLFTLTGIAGLAKNMHSEPAVWNRPFHPDARLMNYAVMRYLRGHLRPGDRIAAIPYGGYFYMYGAPSVVSWPLMYEPRFRYNPPAEFDAWWAEVAAARPRFIIINHTPFVTSDLNAYVAKLPPGYRFVGEFDTPQFGPAFPARVYERE